MVKKPFGVTRDGRAVEEIVLENETLRCSLLTYGAALRGLTAPGREGPVRQPDCRRAVHAGRKELHIGVQRRGEPSPRRANRFFLESVEGGAMRGNRRDVFL